MVKTRFKFCSVPSRYYFYLRWKDKKGIGKNVECNVPPVELVPPCCYREGAYWVRTTPPYSNEGKGYVYMNKCWYEWEGLNGITETWTSYKSLSIKEEETLKYIRSYMCDSLTNEYKDLLDYWDIWKQCRDTRRRVLIRRRQVLGK